MRGCKQRIYLTLTLSLSLCTRHTTKRKQEAVVALARAPLQRQSCLCSGVGIVTATFDSREPYLDKKKCSDEVQRQLQQSCKKVLQEGIARRSCGKESTQVETLQERCVSRTGANRQWQWLRRSSSCNSCCGCHKRNLQTLSTHPESRGKREREIGETGIQTSSRQGWAGETASHLARN